MSYMRINYSKSELVHINIDTQEDIDSFVEIFGCPVGAFPIKYLGISLHYSKFRREDLQL
jgi:hypothetical protein